MESRLVSKKREIERELRLGGRDSRPKQYLISRRLQIENDIRAMGFSLEEVERNEFTYAADKTVVSKQYYVPPPS